MYGRKGLNEMWLLLCAVMGYLYTLVHHPGVKTYGRNGLKCDGCCCYVLSWAVSISTHLFITQGYSTAEGPASPLVYSLEATALSFEG